MCACVAYVCVYFYMYSYMCVYVFVYVYLYVCCMWRMQLRYCDRLWADSELLSLGVEMAYVATTCSSPLCLPI